MPDTSTFLVYGYIVIFGILATYITSLALRGQRVLKKLKEFEKRP